MSHASDAAIADIAMILDLGSGLLPKRATVPVESLIPADSPRSSGEDVEHIQRLAECVDDLPPILVQQGTMRVIDGMHRLHAAIRNGRRFIEVEFFDGDDEEAFIRAVEQNVTHGLPLTLADRKDAAVRILGFRPALSDRSVAAMTGLSPKTVGAIRARPSEEIPRLDVRQGRDGRLRPLDSSEGRKRAAEAIRKSPRASLREIAASAGISPETARNVKEQLRIGEDPVPNRWQRPGRTVKQPVGSAHNTTGSSATVDAGESSSGDRYFADEVDNILEKLCRDPSLRHSEAGRRLLQLIRAKAVDCTLRAAVTQESPPHSRHLLARLARHNARVWKEIASELHRQSAD